MSAPAPESRPLVHAALFAACCVTTYLFGGVAFAATLMAILSFHELGHYLVARRHGIRASLPYFIPLPPGISLGTMGAVIRMPDAITDRNKLVDVAAAGPLAGLLIAIPLLCYGLAVSPVGPIDPGAMAEGNSLLYLGLKYAVTGSWLPADGIDVQLGPVAFAAWVGLLITMINLMPIGQLDGGHVAFGFFGAGYERASRRLHQGLVGLGIAVTAWFAWSADQAGRGLTDSLLFGLRCGAPWLTWAVLLLVLRAIGGGASHPPVGPGELTPGRLRLSRLMAVVFVLIFMPVPLRPML